MAGLRYNVLGPVEVARGSERVAIPAGRQRAVLACLLVHAGRPVTADALVDAAWGDDLPADPRGALHTLLSRLRGRIGPNDLGTGPEGYTLRVTDEAVDARRFELIRERARASQPTHAVELLAGALELWRGPAYGELAERAFASAEAARLERLRTDVGEERASAMIASGRSDDAVLALESVLDEDPFRENAVLLLMTALYNTGRQADALARYRAHAQLLADELGLDPSPTLRQLQAGILGHEVPSPQPDRTLPWGPVPPWIDTTTAFVGREGSTAELLDAVTGSRLVTVTGVGGVGKTRLVAQSLPQLAARLEAPVTVVELATVDGGHVAAALADALGIVSPHGALDDDVAEFLSIARFLVVLDNCEHLLAEVSSLVEILTHRCPGVRWVATSRHRLGLASERVVALAPFAVPEGGSALAANEAVRLFSDRLTRLRPRFRVTAENSAGVAQLCRRVDGLPLALEMAASRAATLGVTPVVRLLDEHPGGADLPGLRALVEWSAQLLTAEQRRLLGYLSLFSGPFGVDAVLDLGSRLGPWPGADGVPGVFQELVEANLVARSGSEEEPLHRMLMLVRAHAVALLAASGEDRRARLAHARWAADLARRGARDWIVGGTQTASRRLTRNRSDVASALRWSLATGHLDVAAEIAGPVMLHLHWMPSVELNRLVVELAQRCLVDSGQQHGLAVAAGAFACTHQGRVDAARSLARAALAMPREGESWMLAGMATAVSAMYAGDLEETQRSLGSVLDLPDLAPGYRAELRVTQSLAACYLGDLDTARDSVALARVGAEAVGAEAAHAFALYASGEIATHGTPDQGVSLFREAAERAERIGSEHISLVARLALLAVLVRRGDHDEALDLVVPLLHDMRRVGVWPQVWTTLRVSAELLTARDRFEEATFLLTAAETASGSPPVVGDDVDRYATLSRSLRDRVGEVVYAGVESLAASLPRAQVVDRAAALLAGDPQ